MADYVVTLTGRVTVIIKLVVYPVSVVKSVYASCRYFWASVMYERINVLRSVGSIVPLFRQEEEYYVSQSPCIILRDSTAVSIPNVELVENRGFANCG